MIYAVLFFFNLMNKILYISGAKSEEIKTFIKRASVIDEPKIIKNGEKIKPAKGARKIKNVLGALPNKYSPNKR